MAFTGPRSMSADPHGSSVVRREGDRIVVWLRGEHDIATTAESSEALAWAIAMGDADLVVDLSEVQFMDASTIGVIVKARNFLLTRSRSLSLRAPTRCARRVLDVCGLAELIDSGSSRSETAAALGSWVAVPASDRADHRAGGAGPAVGQTMAAPGQCEQVGGTVVVPAVRRGP